MALYVTLILAVIAVVAIVNQSCALPVRLDSYPTNPVMLKRAPVYPMMFTGFYRPARRASGSQSSGIFAQGNSISGSAYLADKEPGYLQRGPDPEKESELSSAEAEATPTQQEHSIHNEQDPSQLDDEPFAYPTDGAPIETETPPSDTPRPPKAYRPSIKNKKTTVHVNNEEDNDDNDDEEAEIPYSPLSPVEGNRRGNRPNLNNLFPMMFNFPKSYGQSSGMITAIANSYSTGKGGIASSVATAYGSPNGKKKRGHQSSKKE